MEDAGLIIPASADPASVSLPEVYETVNGKTLTQTLLDMRDEELR
jgi:hypothetical protein